MDKTRPVAEQFAFYSQLGWFDRWWFRHFLQWLARDPACVKRLLAFEGRLRVQALSRRQLRDRLVDPLLWYNREDHEDRLKDRLPADKLPDLLQVVLVFLESGPDLPFIFRPLVLKIIQAGEGFRKQDVPGFLGTIGAELFRAEAARAISYTIHESGAWFQYYREGETGLSLGFVENIAHTLGDAGQFTMVCRDWVPVIGLKMASSLLDISANFHEAEFYFHRIKTQVEFWAHFKGDMFLSKTLSELEQRLVVLETISGDARCMEYMGYVPSDDPVWSYYLSFAGIVHYGINQQDWKTAPDAATVIRGLCHTFEENIVRECLRITWDNIFATARSRRSVQSRLRWEFDQFTDYIGYEERSQDWTLDNEHMRHYWNWQHGEHLETMRFFHTFTPLLLSLFDILTFSEMLILLKLFPGYFSTEEYEKAVNIPVAWRQSVETHEGYDKAAGNYSETVTVARPTQFRPHTFIFERPYLQDAIDLLNNVDKIREVLQAREKQ